MKKYLLISLLALSSAAQAQITQAPNVSQTAASTDTDNVAKGNSYLYGWDDAGGINRRVQVNSSGQLLAGGNVSQWTILSIASYSVTSTVSLNLTATAGSSGVMKYKITGLGPSAGFYHCTAPNATWVGPLGYYAVSTTPVVDDFLAAGTHLFLSATASALTVTVQVEISKMSTVAP